ncbi:MAG: hypothetical protein COB42_02740 [Sulfurimonas sp.]|nr:MAG: hypothetical protein COB42_02740 [Sulfurimonas sp.]
MLFCPLVKHLMTICNINVNNNKKYVLYVNFIKGFDMSIVIKNVESLFEKFEKSIEIWAEKLF